MSKRIVQLSIDLKVDDDCDYMKAFEKFLYDAVIVKSAKFDVVGVQFAEDVTDTYRREYPELLV